MIVIAIAKTESQYILGYVMYMTINLQYTKVRCSFSFIYVEMMVSDYTSCFDLELRLLANV